MKIRSKGPKQIILPVKQILQYGLYIFMPAKEKQLYNLAKEVFFFIDIQCT